MAGIWQAASSAPLVAQASSREFKLLWPTLAVIGAMLLGAVIIEVVRRWRDRPTAFRQTASDQLAHFRSLYDRGELSPEDFNRLQSVLGERIKRELEIPVAATAAAAPQCSASTGAESTAAPPSANGPSAPKAGEGPPPEPPTR